MRNNGFTIEEAFRELNNKKKDLNENVPRDLMQAYNGLDDWGKYKKYGSDQYNDHATIRRGEKKNPDVRLGDSTYEVISKQDAKEYVKQDINNCRNLRMLRNGRLIEVEPRGNNGSVYAIYRDANDPVTMRDRKQYPNVGYMANINDIIDIADKIYKTDEYDHPYNK